MFLRRLLSVLVVLAFLIPIGLLACGDKFLVPSRVGRFAVRPVDRGAAAVLLYARPGSTFGNAVRVESVEARLRAAGYRPTIVTSPEEFDRLLRDSPWDVVVTDLSDATAVASGDAARAGPMVLPVTQRLPKPTMDVAQRQYRRVLMVPFKYQALLEAIDEVVVERARARARTRTGA